MHRKSGLSSGDSLQQSTMQSIMYLSHFKELVSGRNGNTPPSITRYTISVKHNQTPNTHVHVWLKCHYQLAIKCLSENHKILVPFGTMLQKPKGPHLPKISWRMIPKAYTSPLGDPLFWGLRNSSGARQNKSVEKIRYLHYLTQVSWIYRKKKVLKQNLSNHPLCLLYFPKNLVMFAYKWWFWLLL